LKERKKARFKKICWLSIGLAAALVFFVLLLLYKPARHGSPEFTYDNQVSPYLTHELLPELYNNAQLGEPFELVVTEEGINDVIARSKWPKQSGSVWYSVSEVLFVTDNIVLTGAAIAGGVEFAVTVVAEAGIDRNGLLKLQVTKVKIGAINLTTLGKMIAKRIYARRLDTASPDKKDIRLQIADSILNDEPFVPVFKIEDKKVRAEKIKITKGKLTIRLTPIPD
jgi:uncharacterized protein YpmS